MKLITLRLIVIAFLLLPAFGAQTVPRTDVWEPLRYFVGKWQGSGDGQPGVSKIEREYRLVKDFEIYSEGRFHRKK